MRSARRLLLSFLLLLAALALHAGAETAWFITNADDAAIANMAASRGLDTSLPTSELRALLLDGEEHTEETVDATGEGAWSLSIINAEQMEVLPDGLITLSGSVAVSFSPEEGGNTMTLRAEEMLLDPGAGRLTAYGGVSYSDPSADAGISEIDADIVTYLYNSGDLLVSGGTTTTERTNNEDQAVTFHTTGELLNYRSSDSGMFYRDGYLTTNPDTAYSSISADNLALLEGGDMFLTGATLSIGRVPIIPLPVFFYPGSRLSFNPAFGFNSSRGMFLSTTTEIFGTYPKFASNEDESSFSSLLRSDSGAEMVSNGLYYEEGAAEGGLAQWAKTSESYLAVMADVYSESGFALGYDTLLKPWDLTISSESNLILGPETNYRDSNWRWYSLNEASWSGSWGSLSLSAPVYSDPYVLRDYGNRLTSFSLDSIFGASQSFPSTRSSSVTSYDMSLTANFRLPSGMTGALVSGLRLSSLRAEASFDWSSSENRYIINDITLPGFTFNMSGTLFDFAAEAALDKGAQVEERPHITDYFILEDPLLKELYELTAATTSSSSSGGKWGASLKYTLTERFTNQFEVDPELGDVEDLQLDSDTTLRLDFAANMGNWLTLAQTITPSYSHEYDEGGSALHEGAFSLLSTTKATIPLLGLTYDFSTYLHRTDTVWEESGAVTETTPFSFDDDNVRTHSLTLSKSFGDRDTWGLLTPSLKYTLPPLTSAIEPRLGYQAGPFTGSFSWRFEEDEDVSGRYNSDDVSLSVGVDTTYWTFSFAGEYESATLGESDWWAPFAFTSSMSLRTASKDWALTGYVDYDAENGDDRNVVDSLRGTLSTPWGSFALNFTGDAASGLETEYFQIRSNIDGIELYTWKNRIRFAAKFDTSLRYDFLNPYSSSFKLKAGLEFSIAEFLSLTVSVTTGNNGFHRYMENNVFSFPEMFADLMRSFDFFGDGRRNTQFNMEALDIEFTHYMDDWDLKLRYTASLEEYGADYTWTPTFAVYLVWNTMPDLKVDETWENIGGGWQSADSLYAD